MLLVLNAAICEHSDSIQKLRKRLDVVANGIE